MTYRKMIKGFKEFRNEYMLDGGEKFERLADGQSPEVLVIACSDSRIDPAILTRSEPGDIFSVRNVAAMVPRYGKDEKEHATAAAIDYAVTTLKVKHVIVMGHAKCGGVRALAESADSRLQDSDSSVAQWISIGSKARDKVLDTLSDQNMDEKSRVLEQASILVSLTNLLSFPWVHDAVQAGHLHLHGWYFNLPKGELLSYDPVSMSFVDVLEQEGVPSVSAELFGCDKTTLSLKKFLSQIKSGEGNGNGYGHAHAPSDNPGVQNPETQNIAANESVPASERMNKRVKQLCCGLGVSCAGMLEEVSTIAGILL